MAMKFEKTGEGAFTLDVCGYVCPHPQLYTKKSLDKIEEGDTLEVIFDNASSGETITQMCSNDGHEILENRQEAGKFIIRIEKG